MPDRIRAAADTPVAAVTRAPGVIGVAAVSRSVEDAARVQRGAGVEVLREQLRNPSRLTGPPPENASGEL